MTGAKSRTAWGALFALPIFVIANFLSMAAKHQGCLDCYGDSGFPLYFVHWYWFGNGEIISWMGFSIDIAFAAICGYGIAEVVRSIRERWLRKASFET